MTIRFSTFPRTQTPPHFIADLIAQFRTREQRIGTLHLQEGLKSNNVLAILRPGLQELGFEVETGQRREDKIKRPVLFGENLQPTLQYEIDAWHPEWKTGLEVEASRAWMGNAIYRDLIRALVMVEMEHLVLAVPNLYRYKTGNSRDYELTVEVAEALYAHRRITMPYSLCVVGY